MKKCRHSDINGIDEVVSNTCVFPISYGKATGDHKYSSIMIIGSITVISCKEL